MIIDLDVLDELPHIAFAHSCNLVVEPLGCGRGELGKVGLAQQVAAARPYEHLAKR
jgi:hypothetical protein